MTVLKSIAGDKKELGVYKNSEFLVMVYFPSFSRSSSATLSSSFLKSGAGGLRGWPGWRVLGVQ
jgi:hypothetical protein